MKKKLQIEINGSDVSRTDDATITAYTKHVRQEYLNYNDLRRLVVFIT